MIDLEQKLLIIGGKGGVGRSSAAAGLAVSMARRGKKVLAIDSVGAGDLRSRFSEGSGPVSAGVISSLVANGVELSILEVSTETSLQEYVQRFVSLPGGSSRLMSLGPIARVFEYVSKAAPAVKEILTVGKIGHEVRNGDWDVVVVDGPATGHLVELLSAPESLFELVQVGPLVEQTAWLNDILADAQQTAVLLVTTPEELPVSELVELNSRVENETACGVRAVVVNRMTPVLGDLGVTEAEELIESASSLAPAAQIVLDRSLTTLAQLERVDELGLQRIEVAESSDPMEAFVKAFDRSISGGE